MGWRRALGGTLRRLVNALERRKRNVNAARHGAEVLAHLARQLDAFIAIRMIELGQAQVGLADAFEGCPTGNGEYGIGIEIVDFPAARNSSMGAKGTVTALMPRTADLAMNSRSPP